MELGAQHRLPTGWGRLGNAEMVAECRTGAFAGNGKSTADDFYGFRTLLCPVHRFVASSESFAINALSALSIMYSNAFR